MYISYNIYHDIYHKKNFNMVSFLLTLCAHFQGSQKKFFTVSHYILLNAINHNTLKHLEMQIDLLDECKII